MKPIIAPSILAANFANLQADILMLNKSQAEWIHCDIMDGLFVPNISFGLPVLQAVHEHAQKTLDVHLMIQDPGRYILQFKEVGANNITVHYEACLHLHRVVQQIKDCYCKAGVAINPHSPVSLLADIISEVDIVLLMSVNPGFGGQKFIENTYRKTEELKNLILQRNSKALIEIDGGINQMNAATLLKKGADVLVAGNFVFNSTDPLKTISDLKNVAF